MVLKSLLNALKSSIPLFIVLIIAFFLWTGLHVNTRVVPSALINQAVPEFNVPNLLENQHLLNNKLFLGHVSLLNVWATWCVSCANEFPFLVDIAHTDHVVIVGLDYKDNPQKARIWLTDHGNPFKEVGMDLTGQTAIDWGVYGTPETFVIDKQGIIRYKVIGEITPSIWNQTLLPLITALRKK